MTGTMPETVGENFDEWAIVDLLGHKRYVGRVTEQVVAGKGFIRVDVPETANAAAFTKLVGPASVYEMSPVSEAIARRMASNRNDAPVQAYELPKPRLAEPIDVATDSSRAEDYSELEPTNQFDLMDDEGDH